MIKLSLSLLGFAFIASSAFAQQKVEETVQDFTSGESKTKFQHNQLEATFKFLQDDFANRAGDINTKITQTRQSLQGLATDEVSVNNRISAAEGRASSVGSSVSSLINSINALASQLGIGSQGRDQALLNRIDQWYQTNACRPADTSGKNYWHDKYQDIGEEIWTHMNFIVQRDGPDGTDCDCLYNNRNRSAAYMEDFNAKCGNLSACPQVARGTVYTANDDDNNRLLKPLFSVNHGQSGSVSVSDDGTVKTESFSCKNGVWMLGSQAARWRAAACTDQSGTAFTVSEKADRIKSSFGGGTFIRAKGAPFPIGNYMNEVVCQASGWVDIEVPKKACAAGNATVSIGGAVAGAPIGNYTAKLSGANHGGVVTSSCEYKLACMTENNYHIARYSSCSFSCNDGTWALKSASGQSIVRKCKAMNMNIDLGIDLGF